MKRFENIKKEIHSRKYALYAALGMILLQVEPAFAESTLSNKVKSGLNSIYADIFAIVTPLFALVVLIGCARIFLNNGRTADGILAWIKRAALAYIAILCTAWIITFIQNLTAGGRYTW